LTTARSVFSSLPDDPGCKLPVIVCQLDYDFLRVFNDMIIGEDSAIAFDDEPRAEALLPKIRRVASPKNLLQNSVSGSSLSKGIGAPFMI
jgi:hypothetical protein